MNVLIFPILSSVFLPNQAWVRRYHWEGGRILHYALPLKDNSFFLFFFWKTHASMALWVGVLANHLTDKRVPSPLLRLEREVQGWTCLSRGKVTSQSTVKSWLLSRCSLCYGRWSSPLPHPVFPQKGRVPSIHMSKCYFWTWRLGGGGCLHSLSLGRGCRKRQVQRP